MYEGWSLAKIAASAAAIGYQGVELAPYTLAPLVTDLTTADRKRIRQDVEDAGLKVSGMHWLLAKTPFHLNTPDRARREATSKYLLDLIDFSQTWEARRSSLAHRRSAIRWRAGRWRKLGSGPWKRCGGAARGRPSAAYSFASNH